MTRPEHGLHLCLKSRASFLHYGTCRSLNRCSQDDRLTALLAYSRDRGMTGMGKDPMLLSRAHEPIRRQMGTGAPWPDPSPV